MPSQLWLETTGGVVMGDTEQTLRVLRERRALGVSVVIDDYGTGCLSLSYLRRFPVDALKVDRSFVSGLGEHADASVIVAAIILMAHTMRLAVVAEGVETPEQ